MSEFVAVLAGKDKPVRIDAIKVLNEVGARRPELIAMHLGVFVGLLASKDNRIVWGAMCLVDAIADTRPKAVVAVLPEVMAAGDKGSAITRNHAVKAMVKLAANKTYARTVLPLLHERSRTCPVNQLPMYAELVASIQSVQHAKEAIDHFLETSVATCSPVYPSRQRRRTRTICPQGRSGSLSGKGRAMHSLRRPTTRLPPRRSSPPSPFPPPRWRASSSTTNPV